MKRSLSDSQAGVTPRLCHRGVALVTGALPVPRCRVVHSEGTRDLSDAFLCVWDVTVSSLSDSPSLSVACVVLSQPPGDPLLYSSRCRVDLGSSCSHGVCCPRDVSPTVSRVPGHTGHSVVSRSVSIS